MNKTRKSKQDITEQKLSLNPKFMKMIEERRNEYKNNKIVSFYEVKNGVKKQRK